MAKGLFRKPGDPIPGKRSRPSLFAGNPRPGETVLVGQNPQSATTVYGRGALFLGMPFLGMGGFIILMAAGLIPLKGHSSDPPSWVLGLFGAIFAVPGAWFMLYGMRGILTDRRVSRTSLRYPDEPWRADYGWNENGIGDQQKRGVVQMFLAMMFMFLFVAPFNYIAFQAVQGGSKRGYIFAGVDLFAAVYAMVFGYRFVRWLKFGTGRLKFRRFPFFLSEELEVDYVPARRLGSLKKLACTLRCIREAYETRRVGNESQQQIVCYEVFRDAKEFDGATLADAYDGSVSLSFALPADRPTTHLSGHPPIYWELEVSAETSGVNLDSRFLVPVYCRDSAAPVTANSDETNALRDRLTTAGRPAKRSQAEPPDPQPVGSASSVQDGYKW